MVLLYPLCENLEVYCPEGPDVEKEGLVEVVTLEEVEEGMAVVVEDNVQDW